MAQGKKIDENKQYTREELEEILSEKQKNWAKFYVVNWNQSDAARKAGYSLKTAQAIGAENLKKPLIKQYVNYMRDNIEELAGVSKLKLIQELQKLAFYDVSNLITVKGNSCLIKVDDLSDLPDDVRAAIKNVKNTTAGYAIELHDKNVAMAQLSKMMGWNEAKKVEHSGGLNIKNVVVSKSEAKNISDALENEV